MLHSPLITFIMPCMGRLAHLKHTLPLLAKQPRTEIIVVDYSDPEGCGDWAIRQAWPNVRAVRYPGQKHFSLSRARNIGAQMCQTRYIGFIDADVILAENFTVAIAPALSIEHFIVFAQWQSGFSGFLICWYPAFLYAGGYPAKTPGVLYSGADMDGYGFDDGYMRMALEKVGVQPRYIEMSLASHLDHDQSSRVSNYAEKDQDISVTQPRNASIAQDYLTRWNPYPLFGCNSQG